LYLNVVSKYFLGFALNRWNCVKYVPNCLVQVILSLLTLTTVYFSDWIIIIIIGC
jgi:hypothetical protein